MKTLYGKKFTWTHLQKPTEDELLVLAKKHALHPLVASELSRETFRPKAENYDNFLYLILHFPIYDAKDSSHGKEIDFIIGKNFFITTQYGSFPALEKFITNIEGNKRTAKQYTEETPGELLYYLLSYLFGNALEELEIMDKQITETEERLFKYRTEDLIEHISILRREILDFRRTIQPQESVLLSLEEQGKSFFGKDMRPYLSNIIGDYLRVWHILENHKETIEALHETNESLISMRTAQITKNLTIMAFVTFPLTLIASLFGMNTKTLPIVGIPNDFWIIVSIMTIGILGMFVLFKWKKWI